MNFLNAITLLFVPAGVGVVTHLSRLGNEWLPITLALLASTLICLAVTAYSMRLFSHLLHRDRIEDDG